MFGQWTGGTMRVVEYYELVYAWLVVTVKERQLYNREIVFTVGFVNQSLGRMRDSEKATILHNAVRNIFV